MENIVKSLNILQLQTSEAMEKSERGVDLSEAMAAVITDQSEIIKSMSDTIDNMANEPGHIPGYKSQSRAFKGEVMNKSGHDNDNKGNEILKSLSSTPINIMKSILLDGVKEGKISSNRFSKYEMSQGDLQYLKPEELYWAHKKMNNGGNS
jgi:hypothetical protein